MQLWLSACLSLVVSFTTLQPVVAAPSETRYDSLSETELRETLKEEASVNHRALGYDRARIEIFGNLYVDKKATGFSVHDVYCEKDYSVRSFEETNGPTPDVVPDAKNINTEHTWPQSKFGGVSRGYQKSDLHHLFPSDSQMNAIRGNFPFGEVVRPTVRVKCPISAAGDNKDGKFVFEPPVGHRGNVARALFYFAVRYQLKIDPTQEAALRKWNDEDAVTDTDRARNDEIERLQGNRNPFIDHPELVRQISDF